MKTDLLLPIALALLLPACASVHPGTMARLNPGSASLPLAVSMDNIDPRVDSPFQLVQITYENTSDQWVRIAKTEALTGDPAKTHISVVVGKDLIAWAEATAAREDMDRYNREMLQSGLIVAGGVAAVAGASAKNEAVAYSGAALAAGTSAWAAFDVIAARRRHANSPRLIPDEHLYAETTVPPKMFIRRWVLFNKPSGSLLPWVVFTAETVEGQRATYTVETARPE